MSRLAGAHLTHPGALPAHLRGPHPPGPSPAPSQAWPTPFLKFGQSPAQAWPRPDFWKFGNLGPGNLEIWDPKNQKKYKFSKSKSVLPKMSARSGLVGKNPPGPIWAHLGPFFAWAGKIEKSMSAYFLVGQWALFTRFGPCQCNRTVHGQICLKWP